MKPFAYLEAADAQTASAHVARETSAKLLAGGTTLLDLMKLGVMAPSMLVDLQSAPLAGIDVDDAGITLGALATNADVAAHEGVRAWYPMLAEAILSGATPQLRNMATTGGNLLQRTRCMYFRSADLPCNKREPGTGCAAREGVHRNLALLGTSEACIANYPGDMAVALVALDAVVHVEGARRARQIPLIDLHLLPGETPARETVLEHDEVIVAVRVPLLPFASTSRYVKVRDRASFEFALASAAAALEIRDGHVTAARVALGGVGARPWRSPEAEAALVGRPASPSTFARAAEAALEGARPLPGNAFRVELARRTVAEALRRVADGERAFAQGDEAVKGLIGTEVKRVDGRLKVTGAAKYAAEHDMPGTLHGVLVGSAIAAGRIATLDVSRARALPGVVEIYTHVNRPRMGKPPNSTLGGGLRIESPLPLEGVEIRYQGQCVAMVVAETLEEATHAASLVDVRYDVRRPRVDIDDPEARREKPRTANGERLQIRRGKVDHALAGAAVRLDATYETPCEHPNAMELHATIASWNDGALTVYDSTQWVMGKQAVLAAALRIPKAKVRVLAPFVGGMFGSKVAAGAHQMLAALASRALGLPVKVMLTREQVMRGVPYRSRTRQRFELGADADGKLVGMRHTTTSQSSIADSNVEPCGLTSRLLYDVASYANVHDLVRLDTVTSGWMRGPGEATCQLAQEIAMDELAYQVGADPIALRVKNHAARDPHADKPYSSKHLLRCYERGAELAGWARRTPEPGSMKDGREVVGLGMATAAYPGYTLGATVRVDVWSEAGRPRARVATAAVDVGTGMYTLMALTAADALGLPIEDVTALVGDTTLPPCAYAGGSNLTSSVAPAIMEACATLKRALVKSARKLDGSPLRRADGADVCFTGGRIARADDLASGVLLDDAIHATPSAFLTAKGKTSLLSMAAKKQAFHSFGAQFAEVRFDPALATLRVSRMVGVFDCGRVMNARAARSQLEGGMIFGLGMALLEEMTFDPRYGRVMNASLGEYLVPVNADVPPMTIELLDEPDLAFNALGCRGMGEIGNTGSAAAIANAVFHATGKRVRRAPIKIEDLL